MVRLIEIYIFLLNITRDVQSKSTLQNEWGITRVMCIFGLHCN